MDDPLASSQNEKNVIMEEVGQVFVGCKIKLAILANPKLKYYW